MKHLPRFYSNLIALVVLVTFFVTFYVVLSSFTQNHTSTKNTLTASRAASNTPFICASSDTSFCSTEHMFIDLVASKDISDILEHQAVTPTTCPGSSSSQTYCSHITAELTLQLYEVYRNGGSTLLSRNDYITYFRAYFSQYGPFTFLKDTATSDGVTMVFVHQPSSAEYSLHFARTTTDWKLLEPETNK